ncbi:glycosyltransferase [Alcaligenaceae bacterium LF4-65]|uniref:Glycosyltransferase n=1 Tax=Zwartia hollandica TaxID=324606 RepID=A0A953NAN7_9BURK|nr:glycosyltransferase [Zwartia hollandica]MBZ1351028.1 glycosyltransferase [Zwartia hollandica]
MKKAHFTAEKNVRILLEADQDPIAAVAKRNGVSEFSRKYLKHNMTNRSGRLCLHNANMAYRSGDYTEALRLYVEYLDLSTYLNKSILINIKLTIKKLKSSKIKNVCHAESHISALDYFYNHLKESVKNEFDVDYYLKNNSDVKQSGVDPLDHYCNHGWCESRNPNGEFDTAWYLDTNSDVKKISINPFYHWIKFGKTEGRLGKPINQLVLHARAKKNLHRVKNNIDVNINLINKVDIIIPVYNAFEDLVECLTRFDLHTPEYSKLIIINDGSTDFRVSKYLSEYAKNNESSVYINNFDNLGFIKTVNQGMELSNNDIVVLNTDAFVPNNWLKRLMAPIYNDRDIASVTPMSNNGELSNIPLMCVPVSLQKGTADYIDEIAAQFDPIENTMLVPTGTGFCMAFARRWLNKVPKFDLIFGRGYGEEVDWCQKIIKLKGKNVLTGALFVEHRGGASFGSEKQSRIFENSKIILNRYPKYDLDVQATLKADSLFGIRVSLYFARLVKEQSNVNIYLAHTLGGGADIWLSNQIKNLTNSNQSAVVVRQSSDSSHVNLELYGDHGVTIGSILIDEIYDYFSLLRNKRIIYSCLVGAYDRFAIIDGLLKSIVHKNEKFEMLIHDYYIICKSYTLCDTNGRFCSIPNIKSCEKCYEGLSPSFDGLYETSVTSWRAEWKKRIDQADCITVFSDSSRSILLKVWPDLKEKISIKPHEVVILPRKIEFQNNDLPTIGILGNIGYHKGAGVLQNIAKISNGRVKIIVLGELDPKFSNENILVHGKYAIEEVSDLAKKYKIDRWFHPSIIPETFSFTVRECFATGLPVFAFNIGGQAEFLTNYSSGRLIEINSTDEEIINCLLTIA